MTTPDRSNDPGRTVNESLPTPGEALLTVPNILSAIRIAGSLVLAGLAIADRPGWFLGVFVFLALTDWVDGKLAILLNQRTVFGARLDSWADAGLYASLLFGCLWLQGRVLAQEMGWIAAAIGTYGVTTAAGLWKFGRWPSYHTRAAKTSWLLVTIGAVCLLGGWSLWPLRIATVAVAFTNIEATLITSVLPEWRANVPSLYHAFRIRRHGGN